MTKLIPGMLITVVLLLVMAPSFALTEARLLGLSASGQTALLNLGMHDGIKEGEYAVIVKEVRRLSRRDIRLIPVARAKNIKLTSSNSVWILFKVFDAELLVKGQPFILLTESEMLKGRRDPRFNRMTVVTSEEKRALQVKGVLQDDKDRIAKLKTQYPEIQELHERSERTDDDGVLIDVEGWRRFKGEKYRTAIYKSPNAREFSRELRLQSFEKIVTAYLQKVNEPDFNYDKFYEEQKKAAFANEFRVRSNFSTEYENFLSVQTQKAVSDAKIYRSILERGESWSEDFSDEELRSVLKEVSVLQEKDRRLFVIAEPKQFFVYASYGFPMNDQQTDRDTGYRKTSRYSWETEFEGVPVYKHQTLDRFTLSAGVRLNQTATEVAKINADISELSANAGLNWYPVYPAYAYEAPAFFIGTYVRTGTASMRAPSAQEKANYTLLALPGFRAGMKYNFKNNFGLRISATMESLKLDRYEQSRTNGALPERASVFEAKMNFSLAYQF